MKTLMKIAAMLCLLGTCQFGWAMDAKTEQPAQEQRTPEQIKNFYRSLVHNEEYLGFSRILYCSPYSTKNEYQHEIIKWAYPKPDGSTKIVFKHPNLPFYYDVDTDSLGGFELLSPVQDELTWAQAAQTASTTTSVSTETAQSTEPQTAPTSSSTKKKIIMLTSKGGGCRRMKITTKPTEMPSEEDLEIYGPEAVLGSWVSYINNPTIVALIMAYVGKQASRN